MIRQQAAHGTAVASPETLTLSRLEKYSRTRSQFDYNTHESAMNLRIKKSVML
jgi:hypothetical protein